MNILRILTRAVAILIAFCVGWVVYMVAMMFTVYDGFPSMILQPIMAVLVSGAFVLLSMLAGLLLNIQPLSRHWNKSPLLAIILAAASLFILTFGYYLGITGVGINPEIDSEVVTLHPIAAIGGYFFLLFTLVNWPLRKDISREYSAV